MPSILRRLLSPLLFLVALGALLLALAHVLDRMLDPCGTTLISEAPSPNGLNKAVVFRFGCGATTRDSICVAIIPSDAPLPRSGNVLQTESLDPPSVRWEGDKMLVVTGDSETDVRHKTIMLRGISIAFRP